MMRPHPPSGRCRWRSPSPKPSGRQSIRGFWHRGAPAARGRSCPRVRVPGTVESPPAGDRGVHRNVVVVPSSSTRSPVLLIRLRYAMSVSGRAHPRADTASCPAPHREASANDMPLHFFGGGERRDRRRRPVQGVRMGLPDRDDAGGVGRGSCAASAAENVGEIAAAVIDDADIPRRIPRSR